MTSASSSSMIATNSTGTFNVDTRNESSAIVAPASSSGAMIAPTAGAVSVVNVTGDQYNYQTINIFNPPPAGPSSSSEITPSASFNDAPLGLFSAHFSGRQDELAQMMNALKVVRGDVPTRFVLYAGPGVGKTQLTLALAKESFTQGCYKCIFWITATTVEKLHQGFSKLLHLVGHPNRSEPDEMVRLMSARRLLEDYTSGKWLLVLDNVVRETVEFLREYLPRKNNHGNILFTTRTKNVATALANASGEEHEILELQLPNKEDAARLLFGHFRNGEIDEDENKAQVIVKCVGFLPLAIAQAAAFMRETGSTLDGLLSIYKGEHKIDMMKWENDLSVYQEKSVAATFTHQLDDLQRQFPDVGNLLKILAYFDPESIPLDMLITGASVLSKSQPWKIPDSATSASQKTISFVGKVKIKILRSYKRKGKGQAAETSNAHTVLGEISSLMALIQSPIGFPKAIAQLQNRSLTRQQGTGQSSSLWIHDLTRLIVLDNTKQGGAEREWFEIAADIVCSAFEQVQDPESPQSWRQCEILIPHIQSLTTRLDTASCANKRLLTANFRVAGYLSSRGRYGDAEALHKQVLSSQKKQLGEEHVDTLTTMNSLAGVYKYQGRYGNAEALTKQVLLSRQKHLGEEHVDTLITMNNLALVYDSQGQYGDAEVLLKHVLSRWEKQLGEEHVRTLTTTNNLALVYNSQGRYGDAEVLLKQVLLSRKKQHGEEHVSSLTTMNNLALIYNSQGRYSDAEVLFKQILSSWEKQFGKEHVSTLTTMNNLATVYKSQGRYGDAEVLFKQVFLRRAKQLGEEHVDTLTTMNNLALVYNSQGRYGDAEALYRQVLSSRERQLGEGHVRTLVTMNNLAGVFNAQGRYDDAEVLFKRVLSSQEKQLGEEHVDTLTTKDNLASIYNSQGRYCDAEVLFKQALSSWEKQFGKEHVSTLTSMSNLAGVYKSQGRYGDAEVLFKHVLSSREKQLGKEHVRTLTTMNNLALVYNSQRRYGDAEVLFKQVLLSREKQLGEEHVDTLVTKNCLAYLYNFQGRYAEAEALLVHVLAGRERWLGLSHPNTQASQRLLADVYKKQGRLSDAKKIIRLVSSSPS